MKLKTKSNHISKLEMTLNLYELTNIKSIYHYRQPNIEYFDNIFPIHLIWVVDQKQI